MSICFIIEALFSSVAFFNTSPRKMPVVGKIAQDKSGKQLVSSI